MLKTRVAVLRGGPSSEYDVSMLSGSEIIKALSSLPYQVIDIQITKKGEWLLDGRIKSPEQALSTVDVVFLALRGEYGEDGTVQRICERLNIPFTGSNSFVSSVAFNKELTKRTLREHGVKMPRYVRYKPAEVHDIEAFAKTVNETLGIDLVVKPTANGSSIDVVMVPNNNTLVDSLLKRKNSTQEFLIEERIRGTEATVGLLADFRDITLYALPPIEVIPPTTHDFFSQDIKNNGLATEICPGRFSFDHKQQLADVATLAHTALGLNHYSRSDFMIRGNDIFFLEINTLPSLTSESLYPKAAAAVGLSFINLVDHLIKTARVY